MARVREVVAGANFYQVGKGWRLVSTVQSERGTVMMHLFLLMVDKLTTVQ